MNKKKRKKSKLKKNWGGEYTLVYFHNCFNIFVEVIKILYRIIQYFYLNLKKKFI